MQPSHCPPLHAVGARAAEALPRSRSSTPLRLRSLFRAPSFGALADGTLQPCILHHDSDERCNGVLNVRDFEQCSWVATNTAIRPVLSVLLRSWGPAGEVRPRPGRARQPRANACHRLQDHTAAG